MNRMLVLLALSLSGAAFVVALIAVRGSRPTIADGDPSVRIAALEEQLRTVNASLAEMRSASPTDVTSPVAIASDPRPVTAAVDESAPLPDERLKELVRAEVRTQLRSRGGPSFRPQHAPARQRELGEHLGIDDERAAKLIKLMDEERGAITAAFRQGDHGLLQATIASERAKLAEQAGALLTPDQNARFLDWLQTRTRWQSSAGASSRPRAPEAAPTPGTKPGDDSF